MQTQQLTEQLKSLRLRGMASALEESLTALSQKKLAPTTWLAQLLQAEMADRHCLPGASCQRSKPANKPGTPNAVAIHSLLPSS
jgi:hypothetical protein